MVNSILKESGVPHRHARYPKPPAGAYAVWTDDITTDGPDGFACLLTHSPTIELYAPTPGALDAAETAVESALTAAGVQWTKQDRYWLQTEQLYQTIYDFSYIEKRRL